MIEKLIKYKKPIIITSSVIVLHLRKRSIHLEYFYNIYKETGNNLYFFIKGIRSISKIILDRPTSKLPFIHDSH
jgi:hypothetical protein